MVALNDYKRQNSENVFKTRWESVLGQQLRTFFIIH